MSPFPLFVTPSHSLIIFTITIFLASNPAFPLYIHPDDQTLTFGTHTALSGDAKLIDGGSTVQLNFPTPSSSGILTHSTPFNFTTSTSFSANFTFSISHQPAGAANGDGIAMLLIPSPQFPSKIPPPELISPGDNGFGFVSIRFFVTGDGSMCGLDSPGNYIMSTIDFPLDTGMKLTAWVDYRASLKRLYIRLNKFGGGKPVSPMMYFHLDMGEMGKNGEEVYLGLVSSSGKSVQTTNVYSWNVEVENVPKWLHSLPVNPGDVHSSTGKEFERKFMHKFRVRFFCFFIFWAIWGAMLFWGYRESVRYANRIQGVPPPVCPVDFKYENIVAVAEDGGVEDVKK